MAPKAAIAAVTYPTSAPSPTTYGNGAVFAQVLGSQVAPPHSGSLLFLVKQGVVLRISGFQSDASGCVSKNELLFKSHRPGRLLGVLARHALDQDLHFITPCLYIFGLRSIACFSKT